jgi:hypothetical protein
MSSKTLLEQILEHSSTSLPLAEKQGEQAEDQGEQDASTPSNDD